jgi:hypothetical protein
MGMTATVYEIRKLRSDAIPFGRRNWPMAASEWEAEVDRFYRHPCEGEGSDGFLHTK